MTLPFDGFDEGDELLARYLCKTPGCEGGEFDVWLVVVNPAMARIADGSDKRCPVCERPGMLVDESVREGYFS